MYGKISPNKGTNWYHDKNGPHYRLKSDDIMIISNNLIKGKLVQKDKQTGKFIKNEVI